MEKRIRVRDWEDEEEEPPRTRLPSPWEETQEEEDEVEYLPQSQLHNPYDDEEEEEDVLAFPIAFQHIPEGYEEDLLALIPPEEEEEDRLALNAPPPHNVALIAQPFEEVQEEELEEEEEEEEEEEMIAQPFEEVQEEELEEEEEEEEKEENEQQDVRDVAGPFLDVITESIQDFNFDRQPKPLFLVKTLVALLNHILSSVPIHETTTGSDVFPELEQESEDSLKSSQAFVRAHGYSLPNFPAWRAIASGQSDSGDLPRLPVSFEQLSPSLINRSNMFFDQHSVALPRLFQLLMACLDAERFRDNQGVRVAYAAEALNNISQLLSRHLSSVPLYHALSLLKEIGEEVLRLRGEGDASGAVVTKGPTKSLIRRNNVCFISPVAVKKYVLQRNIVNRKDHYQTARTKIIGRKQGASASSTIEKRKEHKRQTGRSTLSWL